MFYTLGIHSLLWNQPTRKIPGRSSDGQEASASDVDCDPRKALSTAARTRADGWCVASASPEWILRVSCSPDEPVAIGWLPQRSLPRLAACPTAAQPAAPAQLGPFQSPHPQVRPVLSSSASLSGTALLCVTSNLRQEPYAVTLHVRIRAGGGQQWPSLPRPFVRIAVAPNKPAP